MNKLKNGFTLVELLIAMVIGLVIMAAVYGVMNMSQHSSSSIDRRVITQQDTRAVLDLMAMEIRMASFNRRYDQVVPALWLSVPVCSQMGLTAALTNGDEVRKGITKADENNLLIAMDLDASGTIGNAPNEYISYAYNAGTGRITRNVNCNLINQPILGGGGSNTMVRNNLTGAPLFQYFDEEGDPITSANLVASPNTYIPLIRRIRINVVVDVENQGSSFKISRRTYSTEVLVKNHVLSP